MSAYLLSIAAAACFGLALLAGRVGARTLDARSGAAISIPSAALLFLLLAPWRLDPAGASLAGLAGFAAVGLFFPALVTLLTFRSNERLGPTVTAAVSATAPLFALLAATVLLGERVPTRAAAATIGIVVGVALLSWRRPPPGSGPLERALVWPVSGALVRGLAQVGAKAALAIWPSAFAASLVGYGVSALVVTLFARARARARRPIDRRGARWFVLAGILNGLAVLSMYAALTRAPVSTVAPIVASYPLVTALIGAAVLADEKLSIRRAAATIVIVASIAYLLAGPRA